MKILDYITSMQPFTLPVKDTKMEDLDDENDKLGRSRRI